ncbi:MAG: hypothetical protein J6Z17_02830 [Treponema sp.]|nr:hypothetical protein [Treponema sp.]
MFFAVLSAFTMFIFTSCLEVMDMLLEGTDYEEDYGYYTSDPDTDFVKTLGSDSSVTFENARKGQIILYANYNKSSSRSLGSNYARHLDSSENLDTTVLSCPLTLGAVQETRSAYEEKLSNQRIKHYVPKNNLPPVVKSSIRSASSEEKKQAPAARKSTSYSINQTKELYVDCDVNLDNYKTKRATLRAKGYDSSSKLVCLVWVVDSYFTTGSSSGNLVNTDLAKNVASTFAKYYKHERFVFGEEGEYLIQENSNGSGYLCDNPMTKNSDTENLVNIVIYDIGGDYKKKDQCGVVGYFAPKDYWIPYSSYSRTDAKYSNKGKYFYLDSAYCNYVSSADSDSVSDDVLYAGNFKNGRSAASGTAITTLFHEFQHMINLSVTDFSTDVPVWYNEMLSMLAEDILASSLEVTGKDAPWGARLPMLNNYYYVSGIDEYRGEKSSSDGNLSIFSYSTAYAFGAWLSRTYGGPEFVSLVSKNPKGGMQAVLEAVNKKTGEDVSANQLFRRFIQACVFRNDFALSNNIFTFNKNPSGKITYDGITSEMKAIDLYSSEFLYKPEGQKGPAVFKNKDKPGSFSLGSSSYRGELRPHGFVLHYAGVVKENGTVTLNFSRRSSGNEDVMVFLQDSFKN